MKKLLLFLVMFGIILFVVPTQAYNTPKLTLKQRILLKKQAKLKVQVVSTWTVNTGAIVCPTIPIITTFTGTNKEIYEKARDHLLDIEKVLYNLQIQDWCGQKYMDFKKLYVESRNKIIEIRDNNYKIYMTEHINKLKTELESNKSQYQSCLKRNSNLPSVNREYCWNDPEITLGIIIDNFDIRKTTNHR